MADRSTPHSKKRIAAAAASIAVIAAFGAGAAALAQGGASFDPSSFTSAYSPAPQDGAKGYQASKTDTDAQANRQQEEAESRDEQHTAPDAFSDLPLEGATGTTAYNATGEGSQTVVAANGQTGAAGSALGGSPATGPVIGQGSGNGTAAGNGNGEGDPQPTPQPGPQPAPIEPAKTSYDYLPRDPAPVKEAPNGGTGGDLAHTYNGGKDSSLVSDNDITISGDASKVYDGQKLDAWTLFCSIDAYWLDFDTFSFIYFGCGEDEFDSYPYFRINSWENQVTGEVNPAICPGPDSPLTVNVSYRVSTDEQWRTRDVTLTPQRSCVFVTGLPDASGERPVLFSHTDDARKLCLLGANTQEALMDKAGHIGEEKYLDALLLGWREGYADISNLYTLAPGRHVIIPGDIAPLDPGFLVRFQSYSLDDDGRVTKSPTGAYSARLQTLVDVDGSVVETSGEGDDTTESLVMPEGVQAIDGKMSDDGTRHGFVWSLTELSLPSSIMYVNADAGIQVRGAYRVADGNPFYAATADGILTSKDGSAYLGIPTDVRDLDIPAGVTRVEVPKANHLDAVHVHAAEDGSLPDIQIENLGECTLVIDDGVFDEFLIENGSAIENAWTVEVAKASEPENHLTLSGGVVFSEDEIVRVLDLGTKTVFTQLSHIVKTGALAGNGSIETLVLMNAYSGEPLVLEDGCLADSSVATIVCNSEQEAAYVESRLAAAGAPDAEVVVMDVSQEGFVYFTDGGGWTTLLYDSWWVESFDGTLTSENGGKIKVNEISDYAFAGDLDLKWVTLDESVVKIGKNAFQNCSSLQGLFIGTPDTISVGANAFMGCKNLGFVASRAKNAFFATDENPGGAGCTWYCPGNVESGYDDRFAGIEGVDDLIALPQKDGSLILYGYLEGDADGAPSLVLGAGTSLQGTVVLPDSVTEIFGAAATGGRTLPGAFEGTGGTWTLDWEGATRLRSIGRNAFKDSGIQGSVSIDQPDEYVWIGMNAFDGCAGLTSVDIAAGNLYVDQEAFADCPGITAAKLVAHNEEAPDEARYNRIGVNAFAGNGALADIVLGERVASLDLYGPGIGYTFTGFEGEEGRIRLHMPDDGQVHRQYLDAWTYRFAGYIDFESMYAQVEMELFDWDTFTAPTEAQIREEMAARLLEPENRLRAMMGLPAVDASTVVADVGADKEAPAMLSENGPDAPANVKSASEAGRIAEPAGINGYDEAWCPTDKANEADATGAVVCAAGSSGDADDGGNARPSTEAARERPTDTEPSTNAENAPVEH